MLKNGFKENVSTLRFLNYSFERYNRISKKSSRCFEFLMFISSKYVEDSFLRDVFPD